MFDALQAAPSVTFVVGIVLLLLLFVANVSGMRRDQVTSVTPSSIHTADVNDEQEIEEIESSEVGRQDSQPLEKLEDSGEDASNSSDTASLISHRSSGQNSGVEVDLAHTFSSDQQLRVVVQQGDFQRSIAKKRAKYRAPGSSRVEEVRKQSDSESGLGASSDRQKEKELLI